MGLVSPVWVISGHFGKSARCPLSPIADISCAEPARIGRQGRRFVGRQNSKVLRIGGQIRTPGLGG